MPINSKDNEMIFPLQNGGRGACTGKEVIAELAKPNITTSSKDLESYLAPVVFSFFKMSKS